MCVLWFNWCEAKFIILGLIRAYFGVLLRLMEELLGDTECPIHIAKIKRYENKDILLFKRQLFSWERL
jgi:hypothetical protein